MTTPSEPLEAVGEEALISLELSVEDYDRAVAAKEAAMVAKHGTPEWRLHGWRGLHPYHVEMADKCGPFAERYAWTFEAIVEEGRKLMKKYPDDGSRIPHGLHFSNRFVEVERNGVSIRLGEWVERPDGFWALRIPDPDGEPECADMFCLPPMHAKDCPLSAAPPATKPEGT